MQYHKAIVTDTMSFKFEDNFQDFPTLQGSLLLAMGVSVAGWLYGSVSHALQISEISESEFWNILEHSTATV